MDESVLKKYAHLIAKCGLNVQQGQEVWITAALDQPEFVRMTVEECYRLGASEVRVDWIDQKLEKLHVNYQSLETLGAYKKWQEEKLRYQAERIPCRLYIESEDPDGLVGMDQEKYASARQMRYPVAKKYRDMWENKDQWCIAAVPGVEWAKKLFPNMSDNQAVEKLWQAILSVSRVDDDPVKAWQEHNREIHSRCDYLNNLKIRKLHYTSGNGTDFTVGMIPLGRFSGASEKSLQGIEFNPNIPSEECFTTPMKGEAEGIVYATKPLSWQGQLIENFRIRFERGKAVEWDASVSKDLLDRMITMDEGASYLGECALVPYDSPIRNSNLLFFNTLFDENAACHLALGTGFADCIEGYENMTLEQCRKLGVNDSMIHVDFMIGSEDMNIDAVCEDGRTVKIFRNGNWAF